MSNHKDLQKKKIDRHTVNVSLSPAQIKRLEQVAVDHGFTTGLTQPCRRMALREIIKFFLQLNTLPGMDTLKADINACTVDIIRIGTQEYVATANTDR